MGSSARAASCCVVGLAAACPQGLPLWLGGATTLREKTGRRRPSWTLNLSGMNVGEGLAGIKKDG